jgi:outer membrane protein OmpA-like peptidoglycan-associated protein
MGQRRKWWIGLAPLLALWIGLNRFAIGDVEADLTRRADAALARVTGDPVSAAVAGRDVTLNGLISEGSARPAALHAVADLAGVRRVTDARSAPPRVDSAAPHAASPHPPSEAAPPAVPEPAPSAVAEPMPPPAPAAQPQPARPAPNAEADPDPGQCRNRLAALMQASPIHFEYKRTEIDPDSYAALDAAAAILRSCPKVNFSVAGHWRNDRLALGRAENAIERLVAAGIDRTRLTALAAGESRTGAPDEARATDRHLEFRLR